MNTIYLDNNATTQVAPEVVEAMLPYFSEIYFNASSMYEPARQSAQAIKSSRARIASSLGAEPGEILFTSCASESNSTAIWGAVHGNPNRRHIITTTVEHPAVLEVCKELQREGFRVSFLGVDSHGNLNLSEFVRALSSETLLVTVMHANNETGVIFPVEQLSRIAKETDPAILFHTDATQTVGKMPTNLSRDFQFVDMLSFSGHKLHAPKGIGVLYLRKGTPCRPLLLGGHQEGGRRAGTENVPYIAGLAKAIELCEKSREEDVTRMEALRNRLEEGLRAQIPYLQVNGAGAPRLPNTSNLSCHFIEGEGMLYQLSALGICASSGSACTSGSLEPSHVLRALKVPFTAVHGSIRFSLSRYSTVEEIDQVIQAFPKVVWNLRNLSPYWDPSKNQPRAEALSMLSVTS
jgi:cysteine desulfurase